MRKKITIKEIAELSNTSKTTVSFYLNKKFDSMSQETRERIEKVIKKYNYTPNVNARSLSNQTSNLLGVLVGDITNTFSNQLVKGIEKSALKRGYQIIIGSSNYDKKTEKSFIERLLRLGVDGFIVQPTRDFKPLIPYIQSHNKSLVFIDSNVDTNEIASVKTDNYNSVLECMNTIIEKNYYDEYVIVQANPQDLSTRLERASGFVDALMRKELSYSTVRVSNNASEQEISEQLISKIKLDKKTLIFVANCWLLPNVFRLLSKYRNLIPHTLGVVGFDNVEWTKFVSPSITTIVQPAYEEGVLVANKLIDLIEKQPVKHKEILVCDVNWQESVK